MNSKAKGSAFERKIAKELSLWYYDDPNVLMRSPSSGAVFNKRQDAELEIAGDIYQVKHGDLATWPFVTECKHHKEFPLEHLLLDKEKSKPCKAWVKCQLEAEDSGKEPMLIFKENGKPAYVVMRRFPCWELEAHFCPLIRFSGGIIFLYEDLLSADRFRIRQVVEGMNV